MLFVLFFILIPTLVYAASITWTETQPAGNTDIQWTAAKMSDDKQTILAASASRLYLTTNGGTTWAEAQPAGDTDKQWYTVAVSGDGHTLLAGVVGSRLYLSTNSGSTWTETQPAGNADRSWYTSTISDDGQIMLAGVGSGRLYISTNRGSTWTETQPDGNTDRFWIVVQVSANGQYILAAEYTGRVYMSTNTGNSWTEIQPAGNTDKSWWAGTISDDGQTMLAGYRSGRLYISRNGGSSWSEAQPAGNTTQDWYSASISGNGQRILVAPVNGRAYISGDNGITWEETQPEGNTNKAWISADVTKNGNNYLIPVNVGRMYIGSYIEPTSTPAAVSNTTEHTSDGKAPDTSCRSSAPTSKPDLFQIDVYGTDATLYFAPATNANKYFIAYGDRDTTEQYGVEYNSGNVNGVLSYTIHMLSPSSSYSFKVRGGNGCMPGEWSNVMKAKMAAPTRGTYSYYKNSTSSAFSSTLSHIVSPGSDNNVLGAKTTQSKNCKSYTVQAGDSLWSIATNELGNGSEYSVLMNDNNLSNTLLQVGQKININCK